MVTGTTNASMKIYRLVPDQGCYVRLSSGSGRLESSPAVSDPDGPRPRDRVNPNEAEAARDSARGDSPDPLHTRNGNCMHYPLNPLGWFMTSSTRVPFTTVKLDTLSTLDSYRVRIAVNARTTDL